MRAMGCNFRVKYRTWWKEVLSSEEEYATAWLFGHYHENKIIDDRYVLLWEQIV